MRYLRFKYPEHGDEYGCIVNGIIITRKAFDVDGIRVIAKVIDKLTNIGQIDPPDSAIYALTKSGTVALEDAEYKLVAEALKEVAWAASRASLIAKGLDFFFTAPFTELE